MDVDGKFFLEVNSCDGVSLLFQVCFLSFHIWWLQVLCSIATMSRRWPVKGALEVKEVQLAYIYICGRDLSV